MAGKCGEMKFDIERIEEGFAGEKLIRELFRVEGFKYFQADLLFKVGETWNLAEVKHQEKFIPPPFYGHGLPIFQIEARLEFYENTGIEPYLFVRDKEDGKVYWQTFRELMKGKYFDTKGMKRRRVFELKSFMEWN